ncbi:MAG: aminopeptidase P family protein [Firmicutes bacterium]|nr:aminopeptidase P family protein [Bacillota bacterium]
MNKDFYINKRKKILDSVDDNSIVVLFSGKAPLRSADQNYRFTPNRNFYYLTGLERENFILLISKRKNKIKETLFIEKPNKELEKWLGFKMRKDEANEISGIEDIKYVNSFNEFFNSIVSKNDFKNLYLDLERRAFETKDTEAIKFSDKVVKRYPYLNINNLYNDLSLLRMIKSTEEIKEIQRAIAITKEGIKNLMKNSKPGIKEYQLEAYFDFTIKSLGAKENAFNTIAASGKNATILHYEDNKGELKDNDLILFDLGVEHNYYCSDISRTFPVNGNFTKRQKDIYNLVLKAEIQTIKEAKPGLTLKELNEITKKILAEGCMKLGILNNEKEISKYYYHGVSHFLGLDTHDVGDYERKLEPGMVITVEPGLYIAEENIGIRIEDDILITEDGSKNLSENIIKTVEEIENFMGEA